MIERSLVLLKSDAIRRGIVGEIITRLERPGLKIVGAKLLQADEMRARAHYKKDAAWHKKIGEINIKDCEAYGLDIKEMFGTDDAETIGREVNNWLYDLLLSGPVFAFVFEGVSAVSKIRALVGSTYPTTSPAGTIRGDFGLDSPYSGLSRKRAVYNLIHASGTVEEAEEEIALWFEKDEFLSYKRAHDEIYSY